MCAQIEEDTDRDRYMSPLEAKRYGLIDHIIGGDDAGFQVCPWGGELFHARQIDLAALPCPRYLC